MNIIIPLLIAAYVIIIIWTYVDAKELKETIKRKDTKIEELTEKLLELEMKKVDYSNKYYKEIISHTESKILICDLRNELISEWKTRLFLENDYLKLLKGYTRVFDRKSRDEN